MKFIALLVVLLTLLFIAPKNSKAAEFELGGLKFSFGDSPTTMSDVQIVGRSGGRSFVGGGVCSKYAYRMNAAGIFNVDAVAICFIAAGTFEDNEEGAFMGGIGISPVSFFNGKLKTFVGYDIANRNRMRGEMTTLTAVVEF